MKTETPFNSKIDRLEKQNAANVARIAELEEALVTILWATENNHDFNRACLTAVCDENAVTCQKIARQALASRKKENQS